MHRARDRGYNRQIMNRTTTCTSLLLFFLAPAIGAGADVPVSPYLKYVYQYADAMLAEGRDTFGPQASGLFLSALDRTTMQPLSVRPAPPGGIRREDRVGPPWEALVGANPHHDRQNSWAATARSNVASSAHQ